ncbi:MAG: T9SS type A sorting domain-containing protein [Saprospiraceae bacterium]|nr:T9SS type A sorting domain-containing protein [Saprospiraceae bacterium]
MKYFLLFLLSGYSLTGSTQSCDYSIPKYQFRSQKDIPVGSDLDYRLIQTNLFVDIYYPVGSPELKRPMVMFAFGGGFIGGKRQDMAQICEEYAKRGFVAATIDYRIGFDGISIIPTDSAEVLRAGFRGAQDGKAALRFLKARHLEDSIDLDRVWAGGVSAGSIVALATVFFQNEADKPKEAGPMPPVGGRMRPDLGPLEGTRHLNGYDTKVQGVFNIFGALLSLDQLRVDNEIAVMSYHQTQDPVVPCNANKPYYSNPFVAGSYPTLYGSCVLSQHLQNLGVPELLHKTWIYQGNQHAMHNQNDVFKFLLEGANPLLCEDFTSTTDLSKSFSVVPNPFQDQIQIVSELNFESFKIFDLNHKVLSSGKLTTGSFISTSTFSPGVYFLELRAGNKFTKTKILKL